MRSNIHFLYPAVQGTDDTDTLGGRLWRARDARNLSIREIARELDVGGSEVSSWESDRAEPPSSKLFLLAEILGVSPAWLVTGAGDKVEYHYTEPTLDALQKQLQHAHRLHKQAARQIAALEREVARALRRSEKSSQAT